MEGSAMATVASAVRGTVTGHDTWWLRVGQVGGVEVRVHPTWWLVLGGSGLAFGLLASSAPDISFRQSSALAAGFALALAVISLMHELGHALAGARLGRQPVAIQVFWLGAATVYRRVPNCPREKALSAAAGPGANLVAALAAAAVAFAFSSVDARLAALGFSVLNVGYALLNLVPAYPQDGGQLLHALLWWLLGDEARALRLAGVAGLGLAGATLAVSVLIGTQLFLPSGLLLAGHGVFLALASARVIALT